MTKSLKHLKIEWLLKFNPLDHPVVFTSPRRISLSQETTHIPFAFYLMEQLQPKQIVGTGLKEGDLYFSFCQFLKDSVSPSCCYFSTSNRADSKDPQDLLQHNELYYSRFSKHLETDALLSLFPENTIDLLYLADGVDEIKAWMPKMTTKGLVLFFDPSGRYPKDFRFEHGGNLSLKWARKHRKGPFPSFLPISKEETDRFLNFFSEMGKTLWTKARLMLTEMESAEYNRKLLLQRDETEYLNHKLQSIFNQIALNGSATKPQTSAGLLPSKPITAGKPPATIIIPVYNCADVTRRCLDSIKRNTPAELYELIVIDNSSTDHTAQVLSEIGQMQTIHNSTNMGFGAACNQGAKLSRTPYLVFLNNDVVVEQGWLESLLQTVERDKRIGVVGAKLINEDGRLQEAGGIIWKDGSGWNYGSGDDPKLSQYNYLREVDYCSGACLLVRRRIFEKVGGFDSRFSPAYYEDTDLCFETRRLGYKVVYQPKSIVLHYRYKTAGEKRAKGLQALNRPIFASKQIKALSQQNGSGPSHVFISRERAPGNQILIIDHRVPHPDEDAGSSRLFHMLVIFRKLGHRVTLGVIQEMAPMHYSDAVQQLGVELVRGEFEINRWLSSYGSYLDIAILWRFPIALKFMLAIREKSPKAKIVFDTIDLQSTREARHGRITNDSSRARWAQTVQKTELYLSSTCDAVWVVSETEQNRLRQYLPRLNTELIPTIHAVRRNCPAFEKRADILFLGGFENPPNVDAIFYFIQDILPLIWKTLPDLRFYIVGSLPPPSIQKLAGEKIIVTGKVDELGPYFDKCRVFVAPLRWGSGVKGKIGESLAHGVPVVTTHIGAEGMKLIHDKTAMIADDPVDFAHQVCELYRNKRIWTRLSTLGQQHISKTFSPSTIERRLDRIIRHLLINSQENQIPLFEDPPCLPSSY